MKSEDLFLRSKRVFPGGVNSPVRFFKPYPFFTSSAKGSRLITEDGRELIDFCMAYGPLIFGHSPDFLIEAVHEQVRRGTLFGTPHLAELELAEEIIRSVPSIEMIRFVNSGGEAATNAIRLCRAFTKREVVVKFDGCYHGAVDSLLVNGVESSKSPISEGIPGDLLDKTKVIPFNDFEALDIVDESVACVIVEPVMGNVGLIPPEKGFLRELRRACDEAGALLIFDEVITGFRLSKGGAQQLFGLRPDITLLGKIIGGGFPIGAFGGRRELMEMVAPTGRVYNAGTFNGSPVATSAGLSVVRRLRDSVYAELESKTERLCSALEDLLEDAGIPAQINRMGSIFTLFLTQNRLRNAEDARKCDTNRFLKLQALLLEGGVFLPPSQFECCFLSVAHTEEDLQKTAEVFSSAIAGGWSG